jgi:hypothetical protein
MLLMPARSKTWAIRLIVQRPGLFLIVVLGISRLAQCAELSLGKYRKRG